MNVFTTAQALASGITARQLAGPGYQRLLHGVHMPSAHKPTRADWLAAARLVIPDAHPGGRTAFQEAGVDSGPTLPIVIARPRPLRVKRDGVRVLVRPNCPGELADAWEEMAWDEGLLEMVALGDRALHRRVVSPDFFDRSWHHRRSRQAAALVRSGSESWRESWLRLIVVLAGLPEPELQVDIFDENGEFVARLDMLFRRAKVALEYDGEQHRTDDGQYQRDQSRRDSLQRLGYRHIVATKAHINDPWGIVLRVADALRMAGEDPKPRRSALWRQVFSPR